MTPRKNPGRFTLRFTSTAALHKAMEKLPEPPPCGYALENGDWRDVKAVTFYTSKDSPAGKLILSLVSRFKKTVSNPTYKHTVTGRLRHVTSFAPKVPDYMEGDEWEASRMRIRADHAEGQRKLDAQWAERGYRPLEVSGRVPQWMLDDQAKYKLPNPKSTARVVYRQGPRGLDVYIDGQLVSSSAASLEGAKAAAMAHLSTLGVSREEAKRLTTKAYRAGVKKNPCAPGSCRKISLSRRNESRSPLRTVSGGAPVLHGQGWHWYGVTKSFPTVKAAVADAKAKMPQYEWRGGFVKENPKKRNPRSPSEITVLGGYMKSALWSSNDDDGDPLDDNYGVSDISAATKKKMKANVDAFLGAAHRAGLSAALGQTKDSTVGHDLWLTHNGHGAGFWDGDYDYEEGLGEALTNIAKRIPEMNLYVHRKKIHG